MFWGSYTTPVWPELEPRDPDELPELNLRKSYLT
jgi:hypothetical protein